MNIDLSKEKQELSELEEKGKRLRADIEQSIKEALSELRELGVQQNTTPNSIRHLLETIYRFEGSVGDFEDYISSHELLRGRGFLYSLIEDQSHGGWQESTGYTEDAIIDACKGVIDYINADYPGQIGEIERILGVI